jgi:hypothetical protein
MRVLKKILITLLVIIFLITIIFWGRITSSYKVYSLISTITNSIDKGSEKYNILLTGRFTSEKSVDSARVTVSYNKNKFFFADVNFKQKHYVIKSEEDSTLVYISKSNLIVSGIGKEKGNFDVVKLIGDVLKDYPQYSKFPTLPFSKKIALTAWTFFNASFSDDKKNGENYNIVTFPIDKNNIQLWLSDKNDENYYVTSKVDGKDIEIKLSLSDRIYNPIIPSTEETKIINVERKELNTAIYRGALRTGGLFLENKNPPKVNEEEKTYGKGILKYKNGNRIFLAKGTHSEIGEAHGALLKPEVRKMVDATLYTICWVYTASNKKWFIDDLREAYKREAPFIPKRFQEEMEGMAKTSGISIDEIRLTNVFPALFHCSGFAVFNSATIGGKLYHGRVLDYITELGLQYYSVISVIAPDNYNAFVNVGFAGFIGSVTGMNEKQVSFGEMGGGGEGDWDGMPMAFLMRDGIERSNTLTEAVDIFNTTSRTCEYYYVIADGKIPDARGLATSPTRFEVIKPNQYHKQLTEPVKDAVLMSAGSRYKKLVERVKENHGKIDAEKAIHLMDRPVAMKSNLHNALFAPQSLEVWVANAGPKTPASKEPYTHYDFKSLLEELRKK